MDSLPEHREAPGSIDGDSVFVKSVDSETTAAQNIAGPIAQKDD
jgi:hypothetical protein